MSSTSAPASWLPRPARVVWWRLHASLLARGDWTASHAGLLDHAALICSEYAALAACMGAQEAEGARQCAAYLLAILGVPYSCIAELVNDEPASTTI